MCTRYYIDEEDADLKALAEEAAHSSLIGKILSDMGKPLKAGGEVFPTDLVPVLAPSAETRAMKAFPMFWGYSAVSSRVSGGFGFSGREGRTESSSLPDRSG